jgi:hypothetical protein
MGMTIFDPSEQRRKNTSQKNLLQYWYAYIHDHGVHQSDVERIASMVTNSKRLSNIYLPASKLYPGLKIWA